MTTPEPPLNAPSASSQALPADQDAHPLVRIVLDTLEDSNAEMHGVTFDATCVNCCGDFTPGVAAAVAAVLHAVSERIAAHHMDLSGYAVSEHIDAWATEITRSAR